MRDIGKNIKDLRQQKGMTQEELSKKLFVTRQTISNYEQGRTHPDIDMLMKISSILSVNVNIVLYGIPSVADKEKKIKSICISIIFFFVSSILYDILFEWALHIKRNEFNSLPMYWIIIIFRPLVSFLFARTIMLIIRALIKIPPYIHQIRKWINWLILGLIIFYVIIMLPFLTLGMWHTNLPTVWYKIAYYLLNLLPSHTSIFSNTFWGFFLGMILYISQPQVSVASSTSFN